MQDRLMQLRKVYEQAVAGLARRNPVRVLCSYVPRELLEAMGIEAVRFLPHGSAAAESLGENRFGPEVCSFCKALGGSLEQLRDGLPLLAGCTSCDQMRRFLETAEELVMARTLIVNSPATRTAEAREHYQKELLWLVRQLEKKMGRTLSSEALRSAICRRQKIRSGLRALRPRVSGAVFFVLVQLDAVLDADRMLSLLSEWQSPASAKASDIRLMLAGSPMSFSDLAFLELLESLGAGIVADITCTGDRAVDFAVSDQGEPLTALASACFSRPPCIWVRPNAGLYEYALHLALQRRVQGVIWRSLQHCDVWSAEAQRAKGFLGLPLLQIDADYADAGASRVRTAVQAFVEGLRCRGT